EGSLMEGLRVTVDAHEVGMTAAQVIERLKEGKPKIWVREDKVPNSFIVRIQTVRAGDEAIIAERLRDILSSG
ncbi:MAG: hypothetical protein O2854_00605, partial [Chloroflexi bacterium]|nr:hypothetical protein [Chloroflexota bacterium]